MSAVSCAKTAELIEMQFGMLSWMGPGNIYYMGMLMAPREGTLLGCLVGWKAWNFRVE